MHKKVLNMCLSFCQIFVLVKTSPNVYHNHNIIMWPCASQKLILYCVARITEKYLTNYNNNMYADVKFKNSIFNHLTFLLYSPLLF